MTFTIGLWAAPTIVTVLVWAWAFWPRNINSFGAAAAGLLCFGLASIITLASWCGYFAYMAFWGHT